MTIRFLPPDYPGGRHLLMCGQVSAGAIFPPSGYVTPGSVWTWRVWMGVGIVKEGKAKTELAAKDAALTALHDFMDRAGLQVRP